MHAVNPAGNVGRQDLKIKMQQADATVTVHNMLQAVVVGSLF